MKYLTDYTKEGMDKIFEDLKVMFAFTDDQLQEEMANKGIPKGTKLTALGAGLILPTDNKQEFKERYAKVIDEAVKQDLKENGRAAILQRELANYEIGYAWEGIDDQNFRSGIEDYGFTEDEIQEQYYIHMREHEY